MEMQLEMTWASSPLAVAAYGRYASSLPAEAPEHVDEGEPHRAAWQFHERRARGA